MPKSKYLDNKEKYSKFSDSSKNLDPLEDNIILDIQEKSLNNTVITEKTLRILSKNPTFENLDITEDNKKGTSKNFLENSLELVKAHEYE